MFSRHPGSFRDWLPARLCRGAPCQPCMMSQVLAKDVELDYAELTVKEQFVPRADLYRFLRAVSGSTAHRGKTFEVQVRGPSRVG